MVDEFKLIHSINKEIFGNIIGEIGLKECDCGLLMEWYGYWKCPKRCKV